MKYLVLFFAVMSERSSERVRSEVLSVDYEMIGV